MSEYQYYEFCKLDEPLSKEARTEMSSLSSRAQVSTHGAIYVYNFGDFRGQPKNLLLKYFDVFFYIANWGTVELMFKYSDKDVDISQLKKYAITDVITCEQYDNHILLHIFIDNENGFGWTEGEGLLPNLLPLYKEIQSKKYQFLELVSAINDELTGENPRALKIFLETPVLSQAQEAFIECVGLS